MPGHDALRFPLAALAALCFSLVSLVAACGDGGSSEGDGGRCTSTAVCRTGEVRSADDCADCRTADDGCGGVMYCAPDPTCTTPCPEGEYREYDSCDDPEVCTTRMACGEEVWCADQSICLAETTCPDGGFLLDSCPSGATCLPHIACGVTRSCPTLSGCQRTACAAGETPTVLGCDDPSIELPCREVSACGTEQVSCICGTAERLCFSHEWLDTNPCTPGTECRTVNACGETFYCKGDSI